MTGILDPRYAQGVQNDLELYKMFTVQEEQSTKISKDSFIWWLRGFLEGKNGLSADEVEVVCQYLDMIGESPVVPKKLPQTDIRTLELRPEDMWPFCECEPVAAANLQHGWNFNTDGMVRYVEPETQSKDPIIC